MAPRNPVEAAVRSGELVKSEACEKCGARPGNPRRIWSYVPNPDAPLEVIWLCAGCWNATATKKPTVQPKRKQNIKKAPPFEQMKADYLQGFTYPELAERWGLSSSASAWHLMRERAVAFGEWPLPPQPPRKIKVNVIWDLVRAELARQDSDGPVWVAQSEADRFAPFCRFRMVKKTGQMSRREVWPSSIQVRYHRETCYKIVNVEDAFLIDRDDAEDWGYLPCRVCDKGISLGEFADRNGFNRDWVYGLSRGRVSYVSLAQARALLQAIKEPIPDSLWTPAERARTARGRPSRAPRPPSTAARAS